MASVQAHTVDQDWQARRTAQPLAFRVLRVTAELTQDEVARRAGVQRCTVSDVENGKVKPRAATIRVIAETLADALGRPVEEIVQYLSPVPDPDPLPIDPVDDATVGEPSP